MQHEHDENEPAFGFGWLAFVRRLAGAGAVTDALTTLVA